MGGASSAAAQIKSTGRSDEEIVSLIMPLYYSKTPITPTELNAAVASWKMIMNDRSAHFKALKEAGGPTYEHQNCMELFSVTFYNRMFDVHPGAKSLFHRSINKQGSFFVRFVSMSLDQVGDPDKWEKSFRNLTEIHCKMGVKAVEWGITGEILMYAIKTCVGPAVYTEQVHNGWCKIYSKMLDVIVPLCVKFELDHKDFAVEVNTKRFKDHNAVTHQGVTIVSKASSNSAGNSAGSGGSIQLPLPQYKADQVGKPQHTMF